MKVLVARPDAERLTPLRASDFNYAAPGEFLTLPAIVCEGDPAYARKCGCDRSFSGVGSAFATTFGIVADVPEEEVRSALREGELLKGWALGDDDREDGPEQWFWGDLQNISEELADVPVGAEARIKSTPNTWRLATSERKVAA